MNINQIRAAISGLNKRYVNANQQAQLIALAIVRHAKEHGDCSEAPRLVRALPPRLRNMMVGWFTNVSPIGIRMGKTAADDMVKLVQTSNKNYHPFDMAKAEANKWYDDPFAVNPAEKPLDTLTDFRERIQKLFETTLKGIKDGKFDERYTADIEADVKALRDGLAGRTAVVPTPVKEQAAPAK